VARVVRRLLALMLVVLASRAGAAVAFVNAGAEASAASGGITLAAPASPVNDHIWVAAIHSSDQVAHTLTDWTQLANFNGSDTTSRLSVWWFRYAGSNPNLIVGHTSGATIVGGIASFSGCIDTGSPVDTTGATTSGPTDASIEVAGFTPTAANCMLVIVDGSADDNNRSTLPTSFAAAFEDTAGGTQNCYQSTIGTPDGSTACHYRIWTTGPTGDFTDTQSASDPWASVMIALKPPTSTQPPRSMQQYRMRRKDQ
jgi:hypothetical protein